ncbi:TonB-dependent receptor [Flavobacteriaceae bacterium F08102]|nr:TonB-dependent receptor [Flavobacteriaceae bacterium F08102]
MKTFLFLFCTTVFSFSSGAIFSQNSKIEIDSNKTLTIDEVFEMIDQQTNYSFIYKSDLFYGFPKIKLKKGVIRSNKLLEKILSVGDFEVKLLGNDTIIIKEKNPLQTKDQIQISGKVTDSIGLPLTGVTVYIKNTNRGTTTDFDGNYVLTAQNTDVLVFTYMGFETQEHTVGNAAVLNVVLKEKTSELEEVVLIGYGSQKRRDVTSSITSIKGKDVVLPVGSTIENLLGGKLAGVSVTQSSGQPGSTAIVNIRGVTSFTGANQPLYVIDGIPFLVEDNIPSNYNNGKGGVYRTNPLEIVSPSDIETIDILKDASATAIYGSRASNGVVLITTKRGRKNQKALFNFNTSLSFSNPINKLDLLNASEYKEVLVKAARATHRVLPGNEDAALIVDPTTDTVIDSYFMDSDVDWQDEITKKNAQTYNVNLNVRGGGQNNDYFFSINRVKQEGIFLDDDYTTHSIRGNFNTNIVDNFKVGGGLSYQTSKATIGTIKSFNGVYNTRPDLPVRNENGELFFLDEEDNPYTNLLYDRQYDKENRNAKNFSGNAYAALTFLKNFVLRSTISASITNSYIDTFYGGNGSGNVRNDSYSNSSNATWETTLTFNKVFDSHNLNVILGNTFDYREIDLSGLTYNGIPSSDFSDVAGLSENTSRIFQHYSQSRLQSYFSRVSYNYNSRYYFTFTNRLDGYSKFGPDNRWAYFPAASVAWRVSNEQFLKDATFIDDLKFRFSYGRTGRANLPDFSNIRYYGTSLPDTPTQYGEAPAIALSPLADSSIGWEKTNEFNLGVDFSFFQHRLNSTINYFNRSTKDMLLYNSAMPSSGSSTIYGNSDSEITNKGYEIAVEGMLLKTKDIQWNSSFNISFVQNTIEKMGGSLSAKYNALLPEGSSSGSILGYVAEGIFKNQEEIDSHATQGNPVIGDVKFKDLDDNGVINSLDRKIIGDNQPDSYGGWSNRVRVKDFEFGFDFQFTTGVDKLWRPGQRIALGEYRGYNLTKDQVNNAWSPGKGDTKYPELRLARSGNSRLVTSTAELEDASFVKLKNISIQYNIPSKFLKKLNLSQASFTVNALNMYTWTKYPDIDPEGANSSNVGVGTKNTNIDFGKYPGIRTIAFGLRATF